MNPMRTNALVTMIGVLFACGACLAGGRAEAAELAPESRETLKIKTPEGRVITASGTQAELWATAQQFVDKGDYQYGRLIYEEMIKRNPSDARSHILLGQLHQEQLGKYADAIWYYKRAERLVPPTNPGGVAFCQRLTAEAYRALA